MVADNYLPVILKISMSPQKRLSEKSFVLFILFYPETHEVDLWASLPPEIFQTLSRQHVTIGLNTAFRLPTSLSKTLPVMELYSKKGTNIKNAVE